MKKYLSPFLMVFIGLLVLGVWTPSEALAWACSNNNLQRLVAEFAYKDGSIAFTDQQPPGIVIYENDQVIVPDGCDTSYVTNAATAQEDDGMWLTCDAVAHGAGAEAEAIHTGAARFALDFAPFQPPSPGDPAQSLAASSLRARGANPGCLADNCRGRRN